MKANQRASLRLGAFELDLKSGELRPLEPGPELRTIILQEQPFRVLQMLIERAGEIATREDLKKKLWPNDTIVDFDHSINVAIGTLRRVLGDSAAQPIYIETVARRGYRLLVPTSRVEAPDDQPQSEPKDSSAVKGSQTEQLAGTLLGKKVSHYRVLEVIGGGGMGMVYKAEDLKLGRRVALKFLPEELAEDPVSLLRFEREAQTASSLNHANICTIFEIEEYEGKPFIVMELLDGQTLRDRLLALGPETLPQDDLVDIAIQICDGLEAAHTHGIIHRDIKPANIFLTKSGRVKILDFGLAKSIEIEESVEHEPERTPFSADSTTESRSAEARINLTRTGMHTGTASYMSPEQSRREKLDARTDLFSFGAVLYEMATGQRAFAGDDATTVREAVLHQFPVPVRLLNLRISQRLEAVITKGIQKDREDRYQSAADMRADLEHLSGVAQSRFRPGRKSLAFATLLLIACAGGSYWHYRNREKLSANDTIVLADVTNQTSDPVLDDAINFALRIELAQTPFLRVLDEEKVRGYMKELNQPIDGRITLDIARQVCAKTSSKAMVSSAVADTGNGYRIMMKAIDCANGKTVAQSARNVTFRKNLVHELGLAGSELRGEMGEPASSVKKYNQPLEEVTSSSLEAIQLLAQGFRQQLSNESASPPPALAISLLSFYKRAVDLDPSFALAWASLGNVYQTQAQFNMRLAMEAEAKAYELRNRLIPQLRYLIVTLYLSIGGDLEKAYPVYEEWVQNFPLDGVAHHNFGDVLVWLGQFDRAADEYREALRLSPTMTSYDSLMSSTLYAGRLAEAKAVFEEAQSHKLDSIELHVNAQLLAFLQHDETGMQTQLAWARGNPEAEAAILQGIGIEKAYHGQFRESQMILHKAEERFQNMAERVKGSSLANEMTEFNLDLATQEAESGSLGDAQHLLSSLTERDPRLVAFSEDFALLDARAGDVEQAQKIAFSINRNLPVDTLVQNYTLPAIYAAIKLRQNDPAEAITILQPALRYDLAYPQTGFNSLYPAYLRGLAYLRMGDGRLAAAEFQKLIDHPAVVGRNDIGALSYLQLGRAQTMTGDKAAARNSYESFLTLWKDADSNIPAVKQAKAEYAKLQ
jgi:serine/threonine protein kinase/tetratricopeptide (TPR) repeat protein